MDASKASKTESEAAEVLKLLVTDYEKWRLGELAEAGTPAERLRALIEESGLTASDLGRLLGDRALGFRILSGERELSKTHIRCLADHFHLAPGYFL